MSIHYARRHWCVFLSLVVLFFVMSACTMPLSLLGNAFNGLQHVKSVQTSLIVTETTTVGNAAADTVKVTSSGVVAGALHHFQIQVIPQKGSALQVEITGTQGKEYVQFPGVPAVVVPTEALSARVSSLVSLQMGLSSLLRVAQQVQLTDQGVQRLNGVPLHHITATLNAAAVKQLLGLVITSQKALGPILAALEQASGTMDFYIDDQTSLVSQVHFQAIALYHVPSGTQTAQASTQVVASMIMSHYNQAIHIIPPQTTVMLFS